MKKNCQHSEYCKSCEAFFKAGIKNCSMEQTDIKDMPLLSVCKEVIEKKRKRSKI